MPKAWSSLTINLMLKESYFPWNQTLVTCPILVLFWNRPITTGDRTTDKLRLPSLVICPGGISLKLNIEVRRGGDVDCLLHPPLLDLYLLTLAKKAEDRKDQNILIRREKEDIHLLLLLPHLTVNYMTMADTKGLDIVHRLYRIQIFYSLQK